VRAVRAAIASLAVAGLVLACSGKTLDVGSMSAASPPDASPAAPDACAASCSVPAGTLQTFASPLAACDAFVGQWRICSGFGAVGMPSDAVGVEFGPASGDAGTAGGAMYVLVQGPSGPVRGSGFAYQYTYRVDPFGAELQATLFTSTGGGNGGAFAYSPCPRELELTFDAAPWQTILVAL
jgi:hypothetical protein